MSLNIQTRSLESITDHSVPMEYPAYIIERYTADIGCLQYHTPGRQTDGPTDSEFRDRYV